MQNEIDMLSVRLGQLLVAKQGWLATAESCTGGLLAGAVTAIAGSSAWFEQGWVTYSNGAKHAQLGVSKETLKLHGAVSEQVAEEMACGVLAKSPPATLALATTGIAGPGGGSADKPVGLVWFGFAQRLPSGIVVQSASQIFDGDRAAVRQASVAYALRKACELLTP